MTKRVLCFGDSLTWGWVPKDYAIPTERYGADVRWTGVLAAELGPTFEILEEGLSGRTTNVEDPSDARLSGSSYLPAALASHFPLDLVILMLGTNDTKAYFARTPIDIATGISILLGQILGSAGGVGTAYPAPSVLLVSPPEIGDIPDPWFNLMFTGARAKTAELAKLYRALSSFYGIQFFDAGSVITTDGIDGIHLTEDNNRDLGQALARTVREMRLPERH